MDERLAALTDDGTPRGADVVWRAAQRRLRRNKTLRATGAVITAAALIGAVAVALTIRDNGGSANGPLQAPSTSTTITPPVALGFDVPWVDRPAKQYVSPAPVPTTLPRADARPCTAADLSVRANGGNGASQNVEREFLLTNISATTCELGGYPTRAVANVAGHAPVVAQQGTYFPDFTTPGNIAPGKSGILVIGMNDSCFNAATRPASLVGTVVVTLPGGGDISLPGQYDVTCRLGVNRMGVRLAEQTYPAPWYTPIKTSLTLPASVDAGGMLVYVVTLTDPTARDVSIDECPSYVESADDAGVRAKYEFALNCDTIRQIAAHGRVSYEMRLAVPRDAPTGPMTVWWSIMGPVLPTSSGVTVQVRGNDHPCTSDQLDAAAPERASAFRGSGIDVKDSGSTLAMTVTNTSSTTCTLQGAPGVRVVGANGKDVGLRYVTSAFGYRTPVGSRVNLAPGRSSTTTLLWRSRWCGPDPNPVRVELTLPGNAEKVTAEPARGWAPPPCNGFDFRNTVSSTPFG